MKNKKRYSNFIIALLFATVLLIGNGIAGKVFAGSFETYNDGNYNIRTILSDYQVFVMENLDNTNHQVGALAVGGEGKLGVFGDGMMSPSYVNRVISLSNMASKGYSNRIDEVYHGELTNILYYHSSTLILENTSQNTFVNLEEETKYIDFNLAKNQIQSESDYISQNGTILINESNKDIYVELKNFDGKMLKTLKLDISSNKRYTISSEVYKEIRIILLEGTGNVSTDFKTNEEGIPIVISVLGNATQIKSNNILDFGYNLSDVDASSETDIKSIYYGDSTSRISMTGKLKEFPGDAEIDMQGLNLIWNFPEYDGVLRTNFLSGHLVAINSDIYTTGGNYEGSVIANSLMAQSEGHFYPFYEGSGVGSNKSLADETFTVEPEVMDPIVLIKTFANGKIGSVNNEGSGCFFTLFTQSDCQEEDAVLDTIDTEALWSVSNNRFEVTIQSDQVSVGSTYYLKETASANGYAISDNIFECIIATDGSVTYKLLGSEDEPTEEFPIIENQVVAPSETIGVLNVTIKEEDTDTPIPGAVVAIEDEDGNEVGRYVTDSQGRMPGVALSGGKYTIKVISVPSGYEIPLPIETTVVNALVNTQTIILDTSTSGGTTTQSTTTQSTTTQSTTTQSTTTPTAPDANITNSSNAQGGDSNATTSRSNSNQTSTSNAVNTSDRVPVILFITMLLLSSIGVVIIYFKTKKM